MNNLPSDILIVIATFVVGMSLASAISKWVDRRFPLFALINLALGIGLFSLAYKNNEDGLGLTAIPDAFISVVARILN